MADQDPTAQLLRAVAREAWRWAVNGTEDSRNDPPPPEASDDAVDGIIANVKVEIEESMRESLVDVSHEGPNGTVHRTLGVASGGEVATAEQQARDMLERMGVEGANTFNRGNFDLQELANLIAWRDAAEAWHAEGARLMQGAESSSAMFALGKWWGERTWRSAAKG